MMGVATDLILGLIAVTHTVNCARNGLVYSVASIVGLIAGGLAGMFAIPFVVTAYVGPQAVALAGSATTILVALTAWVGMVIVSGMAEQRRARMVSEGRITGADHLVSGLGGIAVAWLTCVTLFAGLAQIAWNSPDVTLARAAAESRVLTRVGPLMPPELSQRALAQLPRYASTPSELLDGGAVTDAVTRELPTAEDLTGAVDAARPSVVKISGIAEQCGQGQTGSGFVFAPEYVVTNAHVVAAVDEPLVQPGGSGRQYLAKVVYFNPDLDMAVLHAPQLRQPALPAGDSPQTGDALAIVGYPLGGPFTVSPGVMVRQVQSKTHDIYDSRVVDRAIEVIRAEVRSGNSGGPVINLDGEAVGIIFARSANEDNVGYALPMTVAAPHLLASVGTTSPVSTGVCSAP